MGPVNMKWYSDRGLTRKVSEVLEEGKAFYPKGLKAGDVWEYDEITVNYCAGRIDIRDSSKEGYAGWYEYAVPPMKDTSWGKLSDWLWDLETEEVVGYYQLIEMFEQQTRHKIEWWKEENDE